MELRANRHETAIKDFLECGPLNALSRVMENLNMTKMRTVLFSMLVITFAGALLTADDRGLLGKQELKSLITNAKSAQDHERIARHFDAKAGELEAESKEHRELAAQYRTNPTMHESKHPMSPETAGHCQYFADDLHKASERARQMANDHRQTAKRVAK